MKLDEEKLTLSGSFIAEITEGTTGAMSGFPITLHASISAVRAALATSSLCHASKSSLAVLPRAS